MKNRVVRAFCALLLVCVLLVSWSPIRAQAMALPEVAEVTAKVIPFAKAVEPAALGLGGTIFCWVAMGLGVLYTAHQAVEAYNAYQDFSGDLETTIYYYPDGSWSFGVDMGFVERVRAWLFKDGILYLGPKIDTSMPASVVEALGVARANGCHYFYGTTLSGNYPFVAYCNKSHHMYLYYIYGSYQLQCGSGGPHTFVYRDETSAWARADGIQIKDGEIYKVGENEPVQTTDDAIKLGLIAPPEVDIPTGYPEWHTNSRPATNPDTNEEITVLPIPFDPNTETIPDGVTQPDAWQGSIADPMPDAGTDGSLSNTSWETFKKWISTGWESIIQAIPTAGTIADSIGNVIKSIFVPSPDFLQPKVVELKERFPFIDGVIDLGHFIRDNLSSDLGPPVIYVDFGSATTDLFGHKKYLLTDFAWYAPYKPKVDALMSSVLWAFFGWRVFVRLPSIISGEGGQVAFLALSDLRRREDEYMQSEKQRARGDKE